MFTLIRSSIALEDLMQEFVVTDFVFRALLLLSDECTARTRRACLRACHNKILQCKLLGYHIT